MIECVFTLDYEIYGSGQGSLRELVLDPTRRLAQVFEESGVPFVVFVEAVEFAKMAEAKSDPDIVLVATQLRELRAAGHEIALHLHPWWANARFEGGEWRLDWNERSVGGLEPDRAETIVSEAIQYLRAALGDSQFVPLSFRAGQWAIQPSAVIAEVLTRHGIRVDSSVFKGGRIRNLGLDYRPALGNEGIWRFSGDVNVPDPAGPMWEMPIYTEMVPFWKMLRPKRLKLQNRSRNASQGTSLPRDRRDLLRLRYPRKLDFCRMSFSEMREAIESVKRKADDNEPNVIVAIGHSKDFVDSHSVGRFLSFLREASVRVTTFSRLISESKRFAADIKEIIGCEVGATCNAN